MATERHQNLTVGSAGAEGGRGVGLQRSPRTPGGRRPLSAPGWASPGGLRGARGFPQWLSPGRASPALLRGGLEAGLVEENAWSYRWPRRGGFITLGRRSTSAHASRFAAAPRHRARGTGGLPAPAAAFRLCLITYLAAERAERGSTSCLESFSCYPIQYLCLCNNCPSGYHRLLAVSSVHTYLMPHLNILEKSFKVTSLNNLPFHLCMADTRWRAVRAFKRMKQLHNYSKSVMAQTHRGAFARCWYEYGPCHFCSSTGRWLGEPVSALCLNLTEQMNVGYSGGQCALNGAVVTFENHCLVVYLH